MPNCLGSNVVMLGSARSAECMASPKTLGTATQALYVYVDDVDGHYEGARAAGAVVPEGPGNTDFGSRQYHVLDLEGHPWTLGTTFPTVRTKTREPMTTRRAMLTHGGLASLPSQIIGSCTASSWTSAAYSRRA